MTVLVSKNINGIDSWLMILTMTAKESSWIGFSFHPVVSVDAQILSWDREQRQKPPEVKGKEFSHFLSRE